MVDCVRRRVGGAVRRLPARRRCHRRRAPRHAGDLRGDARRRHGRRLTAPPSRRRPASATVAWPRSWRTTRWRSSRTTPSSATSRPPRSSAAKGRSTGSASPASTREPPSPRFSERPTTGTGRSSPPGTSDPSVGGIEATRSCSRPSWRRTRASCASIDFMPPRETNPDVVRIVEGVRGRVDMQMELVIRFDYGSIVPWVRNVDGHARRDRGTGRAPPPHAGRARGA